MKYMEAVKLLDMAKDGQPIPDDVMDEALFMVGDGPNKRDTPDQDIEDFLADMRLAGLL
jgi:hypothetical protein